MDTNKTKAQRHIFNKWCAASLGVTLHESVFKESLSKEVFLDEPSNWSDDEDRELWDPYNDLNQLADVCEDLMRKHNENLSVMYEEGSLMDICRRFVAKRII